MHRWLMPWVTALVLSYSASPVVPNAFDQRTLETVLVLAGLDGANLPIVLTAVMPVSASRGVEAWTSYDADGTPQQIFVYTGSNMFRCATWPLAMQQCLIRVASAVVHEAWHFDNGRSESAAYEAQITFLMRNGAAPEYVAAVRLAQRHVVDIERRAGRTSQKQE